ncbi:MAG: GAF domain-containing protein [Anaerolineae bacterium]|nr:GAF domain-containing protein [Anaerolineae bacterium]
MRSSLRIRLTVAFIGLAVIPIFMMGLVLVVYGFSVQRTQALDLQSQIARRVAGDVTSFILDRENELRVLVQVRGLQQLDPQAQADQLAALLAFQDVYQELALLDGAGQEMFRISRLKTYDAGSLHSRAGADEYEQPKTNGEVFYGPVRFDDLSGEPFMTLAIPLIDLRSGKLDGVLVADFRFKTVWDLMTSAQVSGSGIVYVLDDQDRVVAHQNPSIVLRETKYTLPERNAITIGLGGERAALAFETILLGNQSLRVASEQPVREALSLAYTTLFVTIGIFFVALALASSLGLWIAARTAQPINELATTAQAISAGELFRQADVGEQQDEIATLALAFNHMTAQLRETLAGLERRVVERTQGLLTAAEVSSATTAVLDIEVLLPRVVELVRDRFNLYYVGLFLADEAGEYAVLRAGTGQAGRAMLARNHRLRVGGESMIGRCMLSGEADIQLDVGEAAVRFNNPDLPETRSELALPLRAGDQVIGAMTVQSEKEAFFSQEDVSVMQTVADQIANAVRNARLFQQVQDSLEAERRAYGELTRGAWRQLLLASSGLSFLSDRKKTQPVANPWRPEMRDALRTGEMTPGAARNTLAIPIKVRDQVIGVIDGRKPDGTQWTPEEIDLLQAMTDQLNVALEGAQLYEDSQRRAAREQAIGQVATRMRESLELERVLQTAAAEMREALGLDRVVVRLAAAGDHTARAAGDGKQE